MRHKLFIFLILLISQKFFQIQAQCVQCRDLLLKDYLLHAQNSEEQLLVLQMIDKKNFADFKKNYPADSIATLVFNLVNSSKDFEDFSKKRETLFNFAQHNLDMQTSESELFNINRATSYQSYEKCVDACNAKIQEKVYAVITSVDENIFRIKVKFNNGSGSKSFVNMVLKGENALILNPEASHYAPAYSLKFLRGKEAEYVFKRVDAGNLSGFKMMVDGKEAATGYTFFRQESPRADINVSVNLTVKDSIKKFVKNEVVKINTPNLYKVLANDTACKRLKGFPIKEWCAVKNKVELPNLPLDKKIYYTNFSNLEPISEEKKEKAYGKYNDMLNLGRSQIIGEGNKTARYEFITTSGGCLWQWKADVYEYTEKITKQTKNIPVHNNLFSFELAQSLVDANLQIKVNGTKFNLKAGQNNTEAKLYLLSVTKKNGLLNYTYYIFD